MKIKTFEETLEKRINDGTFFKLFIEPKTFSDETKAVIRFTEIYTKENFINFIETKGFDYRIDFENRIIYGPRPLTEKELIVFVLFTVFLFMRKASLKVVKWVTTEILKMYEAPNPKSFGTTKRSVLAKI